MTDAELIRQLAERVMGWEFFTEQNGDYDRWQRHLVRNGGANSCFIDLDNKIWIHSAAPPNPYTFGMERPWSPLHSMDDAWMVVEKMRNTWNAATVDVSGLDDDFLRPFDDVLFFDLLRRNADRRWPWAFLYVTPRAICEAALRAVGTQAEEEE